MFNNGKLFKFLSEILWNLNVLDHLGLFPMNKVQEKATGCDSIKKQIIIS